MSVSQNLQITLFINVKLFYFIVEDATKPDIPVVVLPTAASYGSIGPPTQQDCCCCCLRKLNSSEAPSLMDRNPTILSCPNCLSPIYTRRRFVTDKSTHLSALLLSPLCLCLLPYHLQCCKSVRHHCPVCDNYIGYSR